VLDLSLEREREREREREKIRKQTVNIAKLLENFYRIKGKS
jgi:hypothetical protein